MIHLFFFFAFVFLVDILYTIRTDNNKNRISLCFAIIPSWSLWRITPSLILKNMANDVPATYVVLGWERELLLFPWLPKQKQTVVAKLPWYTSTFTFPGWRCMRVSTRKPETSNHPPQCAVCAGKLDKSIPPPMVKTWDLETASSQNKYYFPAKYTDQLA